MPKEARDLLSLDARSYGNSFRGALFISGLGIALACGACGGDDEDESPGPLGDCPTDGTGTIELRMTGLPGGVAGQVFLTGSSTGLSMTESGTQADQASGPYTIRVNDVAGTDSIVRPVYRGTSKEEVCVRTGQTTTVDVAYQTLATSNKLWTTGAASAGSLVGYASAQLGTSATVNATSAARVRDAGAHTFDQRGNLWVAGGTTEDPALSFYDAGNLSPSDRKGSIEIDIPNVGCFPRWNALAFDTNGNLWISIQCQKRIVRVTSLELRQSGSVTPTVEITGLDAPTSLAFDASGNLWVADGKILKYSSQQTATSTSAPELTISLAASGQATAGSADALAFDAAGNLWATVSANYNFAKLTPSDLTGTGAKDVTPSVYISTSVTSLPGLIAFDESGALWSSLGSSQFARLAPEQLSGTTTYANPVTPSVTITSSDANASNIVFYPAAAGLPLYHRIF